jgi:AhpD family alkylhydroperoxidase
MATKEVARLRNARTTGCNYCKAVRFAGARDAGLTEDRVDLITDDYASSPLDNRDKVVIDYVDTMLHDPHGMTVERRAALAEHLDDGQLVELTLGIGLFHGFSKIAVALGPPPDMPTMVVPTPDWPPSPAS